MIKSSMGTGLARARNLAYDHKGDWIDHTKHHEEEIPCRETRSCSDPDRYLPMMLECCRTLARLTDQEIKVLELQGKVVGLHLVKRTVGIDKLHDDLDGGYCLVKLIEHANLAMVEGYEPVNLTHVQIAEHMGLTPHQVHRRTKTAWRKVNAQR